MNKLSRFELKVLSTIKKYNMITAGDKVLVGLSGGKDSAVLLYVLSRLSSLLKIELTAFHLNHGIRGEEADRDEAFSKSFADSLNVPFYSEKTDVIAMAEKSDDGLEAVARRARYEAFQRCSESTGCNKIATAHTLSDNTETVFISLLRNATLSPIPPVRHNIIRPLVECLTEEVIEYAEDSGISYVFDSTNSSENYLRNFLRLSIIPLFRQKNKGFDDTILKSGKIYSSLRLLCQREVRRYLEENTKPYSPKSLCALALEDENEAVLYFVISELCQKDKLSLNYDTFERIKEALKLRKVGAEFTLSKSKRLVIEQNEVKVCDIQPECADYLIKLHVGYNDIPNSPYAIVIEEENVDTNQQKINKITKNIQIGCNIINDGLYARPRKTGDAYKCSGITRNIKKYMIDAKIGKTVRNTFPIVCDSEGIVWVAGIGVCDRLKSKNEGAQYFMRLDVKNDN